MTKIPNLFSPFWSLEFEYCLYFVIWCLGFSDLKDDLYFSFREIAEFLTLVLHQYEDWIR